MRIEPVFLFDIEGTRVDSVYEQGLAGKEARAAAYRKLGAGVRWAIATSGRMETAEINSKALGVDLARTVVVTRDQVKYAKPDPDLFLAVAERLGAAIETAYVVGDSI